MAREFAGGSLGQRIKMKRLESELTQEELAAELQISAQHISAIELDRRLPSVNFLARLAGNLNVTTDFLITGKHPSASDPIAAIDADDKLSLEARKALIVLIKLSRQTGSK